MRSLVCLAVLCFLLLLAPGSVRADDCASASDCQTVPSNVDAATGLGAAAAAVAIGAAVFAVWRQRRIGGPRSRGEEEPAARPVAPSSNAGGDLLEPEYGPREPAPPVVVAIRPRRVEGTERPEEHSVLDHALHQMSGSGEGEAAEPTKDMQVAVVLTGITGSLLDVVRVLASVRGISPGEATTMLSELPVTVVEDIPQQRADEIRDQLVQAGGQVELR